MALELEKKLLGFGAGKSGPPGPPAKPSKGKTPPGPPPSKPKPVNKPPPMAPQKSEFPKTASLHRNANTPTDAPPTRSNSTSFPKKPNPLKTQPSPTPKVEAKPEPSVEATKGGYCLLEYQSLFFHRNISHKYFSKIIFSDFMSKINQSLKLQYNLI